MQFFILFCNNMLEIQEIIWSFSIISLLVYLFRALMTVHGPPFWVTKLMVHQLGSLHCSNNEHYPIMSVEEKNVTLDCENNDRVGSIKLPRRPSKLLVPEFIPDHKNFCVENKRSENVTTGNVQTGSIKLERRPSKLLVPEFILDHKDFRVEIVTTGNVQTGPIKLKRRPSKLLVPEFSPDHKEFCVEKRRVENVEFESQGKGYCLVSKKGRREHIEDRFKVISDISGDPNKAFFAVIDGHGGQEAANYVANNLGINILKNVDDIKKMDQHGIEQAIFEGYSQTDKEFLRQEVGSGACAASVLISNGELHAANVGDCRVVLSKAGLATRLTNDHRSSRPDERIRIENSGGFVHNSNNGVWRVQGTLAVSRAFGDKHLKDFIISEPEIQHLRLTSDCEFLVIASDGLWDKVNDQEAVDIVSTGVNAMESCKKLVDVSCSRGNRDDITVMVINLQTFVTTFGAFV